MFRQKRRLEYKTHHLHNNTLISSNVIISSYTDP